MSLQGWQADVFSQASGLSSCHCAFLKAVHVIGLVSLCCCKVVGFISFSKAFGLSSAHCNSSEGCACDRASTICRCKGARFMSFRKAFGLILFSS